MFSTFSVHRNKLQERNKWHTDLCSELFLVIVALLLRYVSIRALVGLFMSNIQRKILASKFASTKAI